MDEKIEKIRVGVAHTKCSVFPYDYPVENPPASAPGGCRVEELNAI